MAFFTQAAQDVSPRGYERLKSITVRVCVTDCAGDSKHSVSVEKGKSARLYFEFQEMQDGNDAV